MKSKNKNNEKLRPIMGREAFDSIWETKRIIDFKDKSGNQLVKEVENSFYRPTFYATIGTAIFGAGYVFGSYLSDCSSLDLLTVIQGLGIAGMCSMPSTFPGAIVGGLIGMIAQHKKMKEANRTLSNIGYEIKKVDNTFGEVYLTKIKNK